MEESILRASLGGLTTTFLPGIYALLQPLTLSALPWPRSDVGFRKEERLRMLLRRVLPGSLPEPYLGWLPCVGVARVTTTPSQAIISPPALASMQPVNPIPQQCSRLNGRDGEREEQFSQVGAEVYGLECEAANCSPTLVVFAVRPKRYAQRL